jgi:hypothetical protein
MKMLSYLAVSVLGFGALLFTAGGCQTDQPGVKNVLGTYTAMVDSRPDKVTNAAKKAVEQMQLTDVTSTATKIDGKVTAMNAQKDAVTINVEQAGENVSKVTIRVGTTGDEAVSKQILDKIKSNL